MGKEAVLAKFKILSRMSPRGTEENDENPVRITGSSDGCLDRKALPRETEMLTIRPRYSVSCSVNW